MAVSKLDVIEQYMDNNGDLLALGKIHTYTGQLGGSTTPLATYSDNNGTANANPVVLDSSGRCQIWFTQGVAYNVVITDADDVVLQTIEMLEIPEAAAAVTGGVFVLDYLYHGTAPPNSSEWLGGYSFTEAVDFPINFGGAFGKINTNPTASFAIDLRKNGTSAVTGTSIGTVTIATNGTVTFASAASAAQSLAAGDDLDAWAPAVADTTANDFNFTLKGTLA